MQSDRLATFRLAWKLTFFICHFVIACSACVERLYCLTAGGYWYVWNICWFI